jgi:K+-transporting ATPase ATPase C chain
MKELFIIGFKLTIISFVLLAVIYPLLIWGIAKSIAPNGGKCEEVFNSNKMVGYALIGQNFRSQHYFQSRPSAVNYNAAGSGGSNKGFTNPDYLKTVKERRDSLLKYNPTLKIGNIPAELVTASGSGLDPHLTPESALVQVPRIAEIRNISENDLKKIIAEQTELPFLGIFGKPTVHVLKLNVALDQKAPLKKQ